jgi:hypothetical protein
MFVDCTGRFRSSLRAATPALLGYAAVRALGVLIVVLWTHRHGESGMHRLGSMWDANWYQTVVAHGYAGSKPVPGPHGNYEAYAFFPLYPGVTWLVHAVLTGSVAQAALTVSWVASLVAAWGVFAVADQVYGRRVGTIATVLWGVIPFAIVESIAYSEPLFTVFAVWAMYATLTGRWIWAGLLSSLAGLTRPTAAAVAGAIGIAALATLGGRLWRRRGGVPEGEQVAWWRPLLGAAIAPLGFVGFILWVGWQKHSLTGYFTVQQAWESKFDFGRATLQSFHGIFMDASTFWLTDIVVAFTLVSAVLLLILSAMQRQPLVLWLFSALVLVLAIGDAAYFNSRARFVIPAIGLLLPIATTLGKVRTRGAVTVVLAFAAVWSGLFGGYIAFVYTNSP